ncbi:UbiX family flavin prenyltransferase [Aestuariibacter halophilus]|uniref:Flavin prenyltransferase UbiX n=1 Tax=Fluctibacter halophilus TaxID=226011 RepID=A0ABS8GCV1_9ALTE|nr:flavin prenyltransferase UbiX [Aestuariibacter halophilus]MCC2617619.1 UbiX family flavin prenyltransferase [Aestuariibacter halophilus]
MQQPQTITVAFTGASGAPYGLRLVEKLLAAKCRVYLLISSAARVVMATEQDLKIPAGPDAASAFFRTRFGCEDDQLTVFGKDDWFSPVASGSAAPRQMVICPCSTGTLSAVATGKSDNLIERGADVVLKERGQLIVVPREMPLSTLHLENMLALSRMGVTVMPAAPGFYHQPESIQDMVDFVVARILDHLAIEQTLVPRWGYQPNGRDHRS